VKAKVFIRQLSVPAIIGVFPEERTASQTILIDVELETDIQQAAQSDDLQYTIDYAAVRRCIIDYIGTVAFELLETLAAKLADHLKQNFKPSRLCLTITKKPFDIPDVQGVGVIIELS